MDCLTDESNFHRALITHNPKKQKVEGVRKGGDAEVCGLRKKYSSPGCKAAN